MDDTTVDDCHIRRLSSDRHEISSLWPWITGLAASVLLVMTVPTPASAQDVGSRRVNVLPTAGLSCLSAACAEAYYHYTSESWSSAADAFESAIGPEARAGGNWDDLTLLLVGAARSLFKSDAFIEAGHRWRRVAAASPRFTALAEYRALVAYTRATSPPTSAIEMLVEGGALDREFPGIEVTRLRVRSLMDGPVAAPQIDHALAADRARTCQWLDDSDDEISLQTTDDRAAAHPASIDAYLWSECVGVDSVDATAEAPDSPSEATLLRRATRLYDLVRYDDAYSTLSGIRFQKVTTASLTCRLTFRLARTQERRDNHTQAAAHDRTVVDTCGDGVAPDSHIRSLYALGDYHFVREHFQQSKQAFQTLYETYPDRSHADDALMFLGRIARERGDRAREKALLDRALSKHPGGDMIFEFAWEFLEEHVRDDEWKAYLESLSKLSLPDHDEQPYSQGRLAYFRGRAHQALERPEQAAATWAKTWRRYPFSFYGYLSRMHLGPKDDVETSLLPSKPAPADWFLRTADDSSDERRDTENRLVGTRRLASGGFLQSALTYQRAGTGTPDADSALWRQAALWDALGQYHHSHNVARIRIDGRPWVQPERGRLARWSVAYPDAYRGQIVRAVLDESSEHDDADVSPALASALMREESAFLVDVESWAGALGLMQLMPATARGHREVIDGDVTRERLLTSWPNIRIGVAHLFMLADDFSNHPVKMLAAYNAGGGAVNAWDADHTDIALWVEDIPYRQTRHYVKRVIGSYAAYQWLAGERLDPTIALPP